MKNYKKWSKMLIVAMLAVTLTFGLTGCVSILQIIAGVSAISSNAKSTTSTNKAGPNESIVFIKRNNRYNGSAVGVNIFIDDQKVASVANGRETSFTVQNGKHTIIVARSWGKMKSGEITFEVNSEKINFTTGFGKSGLELIMGSTVALEENESNRDTATQ